MTTPTVSDAALARRLRDDRGSASSRAAAHAGGDETHMRAGQMVHDLVERFLGRGLGRSPGSEPAPRPSVTCAPSWISRVAFDMVSAWASVLAAMNSVP